VKPALVATDGLCETTLIAKPALIAKRRLCEGGFANAGFANGAHRETAGFAKPRALRMSVKGRTMTAGFCV
jgi:hypothetical protein